MASFVSKLRKKFERTKAGKALAGIDLSNPKVRKEFVHNADQKLQRLDDKVGGAKGWAKIAGGAAVIAQVVPGVGSLVGAGLGIASGALVNEDKQQQVAQAEAKVAEAAAAAIVAGVDPISGLPVDSTGKPLTPIRRLINLAFPRS